MSTTAPAVIAFHVAGTPRTKGSLRPWHKRGADRCTFGLSEQGGFELAHWRTLVATEAKRAMRHAPPLDGPLRVDLTFIFPPPQKHDPSPFVWGNRRWDIDKLERAVLDALTDAALWKDDSQVAQIVVEKRWYDGRLGAGVHVTVEAAS